MSRVRAVALILSLLASGIAQAAPVPLAPAGKWNLHYAENSCQLKRNFGDPANPTTLVFERITPSSPLTMMVFGDPLRAKMESGSATAVFLPFAKVRFREGDVAETIDTKKTALLWTSVNLMDGAEPPRPPKKGERYRRDLARKAADLALESANAAKVTGIQVTEPGAHSVVLATGPLDKGLAMMRQCAREQLADWGVDPDLEDRIVVPARSKTFLGTYLKSSDYPRDALSQGKQAILQARLNVGADGKVTNCTSLTAFRAPEFANVVCRSLSKAEFEPAELEDGTKVPSYITTTIRYEI
ncbi:energy transducer TonB [Sphingomonas astaxanthinifaciens]|uniref:TonB C-terminal domain-containing protein n=1 Tax=Sphingomonas astaxanthinifaciens DSM 22298 TaxID=1123267 RepID=A0ABQ5ZC20_9SPHN|nr:energy transducer TonB [Sphingomonas astaxanthinifaciens]GLR48324.1 hypothetical protein GCM10007925_20380 [Sphingomonas astaxanthinifaciens DSM 22298]